MENDIYTQLRSFLDSMPGSFPTTETGVEIRMLKKLFTPEEAELTMKLSEVPEIVGGIADRLHVDSNALGQKLEEMAQKGLIFRVRRSGEPLYQAYQFLVVIYEFQLKHLDKEFAEMFEEFLPYYGLATSTLITALLLQKYL